MNTGWVKSTAGDRVYKAIKARVIAYGFPEGQRIYLEPLAEALGVSTTPVREAMNRLAAEDLVIKASHKGFFAISLSERSLRGHYELSKMLLVKELESLDAAARRKLSKFEPISEVLYKLNRRSLSHSDTLVAYTGEVFLNIASVGENVEVVRSIRRANDQLYFIRTIECRYLEDIQEELKLLCELLLAGRCEDLLRTIHGYYDKRIELLPTLLNQP